MRRSILGRMGIASVLSALLADIDSGSTRTELRKVAERPLPRAKLGLTLAQHQYHYPGYKGQRVLSRFMAWFLDKGATSRKQLEANGTFYKPHQGSKERARHATRSAAAS